MADPVPVYAEDVESLKQRRAADERMPFNGGRLTARALQHLGVKNLFTLSGGHIFPIYDGCVELGIRIIDVRHEEHAVHAAEGWSKVTRQPGVAAVTAGPGVTNAITGMASALYNRSPLLVIGGRAPDMRWGQGSLQEMDHVPLARAVTKSATTLHDPDRIHLGVYDAWESATTGIPGPAFIDMPMDCLFTPVDEAAVEWPQPSAAPSVPDPDLVAAAVRLIKESTHPVVLAGSGVHWHHGEDALRDLAETAGLPVFVNGMGRGTLPSDHPNAYSRIRAHALESADLVIVLGTPLDFRLNFGESPPFPKQFKLIRIDYDTSGLERNRVPDVGLSGDVGAALAAIATSADGAEGHREWLDRLRQRENLAREEERAELDAEADPIHPMRIYGELLKLLDRDAIVIGDGGDFVSYAGRVLPTYLPGHWLDPGPFGTLGMGPGQAIAARLAHPDKQVVLLLGDGAFGFAGLEFDTMVRHRLPIVAVMGNNAAWGLEKDLMEGMFVYSVAAELNPAARYDEVVRALGGHGELVTHPQDIGPALKRAFDSGLPALVNVMCDPAVKYPRQTRG